MVNNIPASVAKDKGLYGKDKLSDEEYDRKAKKRIYSSMRGSVFEPMRALGKKKMYGSREADDKRENRYRGKRWKITKKDDQTHPKDLIKGARNILRDQSVEQLKRSAITQSSAPGYNPIVTQLPVSGRVKKVLGLVDTGISFPYGPGSNRNRSKALERMSRMDAEKRKEIENNGYVDPIKEKIRNIKGRITVDRALKTLPQTKGIEKDHTINVGKTILGRSLTNEDFSNLKNANKVFKKIKRVFSTRS